MNILILNSSPRRQGIISTMMQIAAEEAGKGNECEVINLYDAAITPCIGCMKCRATGNCVLAEDDGHRIGRKIAAADLLIVGAPAYWGNMNAVLKNLFDRTVYVFMGESKYGAPAPKLKGRRAIVVTACSAPRLFDLIMKEGRGAVRSIKKVLGTGGYKIKCIEITGTKNATSLPDKHKKRLLKILSGQL